MLVSMIYTNNKISMKNKQKEFKEEDNINNSKKGDIMTKKESAGLIYISCYHNIFKNLNPVLEVR